MTNIAKQPISRRMLSVGMFVILLLVFRLAQAVTVTAFPTSCTSTTSSEVGTVSWSNTGNAYANDGNYANVALTGSSGQVSRYLKCTGYNFAIPSGATINGITVTVERYASSASNMYDYSLKLLKAGVLGSGDLAATSTAYPNSATAVSYGSHTNLWGDSWTASDINNSGFGVALSVQKTTANNRTAYVDYIAISVSYVPSCSQPSNTPSGLSLSCVCDNFDRSALNPSTIYSSNWWVSHSDSTSVDPYINTSTGNLRLTENTTNNAKAATVPGIFPASGNYISVEFYHYAYNTANSGADGIAVTLSDYSLTATPGAYGGSLGYAQKTSISGFNGGWIGVGIDEYGNYQNPTEGRNGGPGARSESVAVRGSGNVTVNGTASSSGYYWLKGTSAGQGVDAPSSTIPAPGYLYQVIVDARNASSGVTYVAVNRDTTGTGNSYSSLISSFDVFATSLALSPAVTQSPVPTNWKISFTGSTGDYTNIHELSGVRICAQTVAPITGGIAGGFNAIDGYLSYTSQSRDTIVTQGQIYTKLVGTPFTLQVAALNSAASGVLTTYAASATKTVTLELFDESADSGSANSCNASASACQNCNKTKVAFRNAVGGADLTSQTMSFTASDAGGPKTTPNFIVNNAYKKLLVRMNDGTTYGCSTDWFSVRPTMVSVFTTTAGNASTSGTPILKAGSGSFTLTATATNATSPFATNAANASLSPTMTNYTGVLSIAPAVPSGWALGTLNPTAFTAASSGVATTSFTYSEAGYFTIGGYNPGTAAGSSGTNYDTTTQRGIYDNTWTVVDNVAGVIVNCKPGGYENVMITSGTYAGMYGCNFGLTSASTSASDTPPYGTLYGVGRFTPDHFSATGALTTRADVTSFASTTGGISSGSTVLTVASASGISAGNVLRIVGAGLSGASLVSIVSSISGTTVTLSSTASTAVSGATVYNLSSPSTTQDAFTYMDEPMLLVSTVTARNASEGITTNYADSTGVSKLAASTLTTPNWMNVACSSGTQCFGLGAVNGTTTALSGRLANVTSVSAPVNAWIAGVGTFVNYLTLARGTSVDGTYDTLYLGVAPQDADNITLPAASSSSIYLVNLDANLDGTPERRLVATTKARFGRLRLSNAFGSEKTTLQMPLTAQYWSGNSWVLNSADSGTSLVVGNFALSGGIPTKTSVQSVSLSSGSGYVLLAAPGAGVTGSVDVAADLGPSGVDNSCLSTHAGTAAGIPWLRSRNGNCATTYDRDPSARATFGIYAPETRKTIHVRELF